MELTISQKERFLKIIEGSPKHIGQSLLREKNSDLLEWVNSHKFPFEVVNLTELVYLIMSDYNPVCHEGKKRRFISWVEGYGPGCGRPKECPCVFKLVNDAHHRKIEKLDSDPEYRKKISNRISKKLHAFYERTSDDELRKRFDKIKASLQSDEVKEKRAKTKIEKGLQIDPADRTDRDEYYYQVGLITEQNFRDHYYDINPEKLPRGEYHLDHIYSKIAGYVNRVPPEIVGHWKNLRLITELQNKEKSGRCDHTIEELMEKIQN